MISFNKIMEFVHNYLIFVIYYIFIVSKMEVVYMNTILIVDDNENIRKLIEIYLKKKALLHSKRKMARRLWI